MRSFQPGWLPFAVGSMPQVDAMVAWDLILRAFPSIPGWPQLPRRTYLENMYVQFSEGFPGVTLADQRIYVDRQGGLEPALERLYLAYFDSDLSLGRMGHQYAAGLGALLRREVALPQGLLALKGQVTGPVSWGLTVVDQNRRPILYDEVLCEAVAMHLRLKAAWQERELARLAPETIMFIDEPYMASYGSAYVSLGRDQARDLLEEVLAGLKGLKGIHCCGNTDWSIILNTSADILSLDAYDYWEKLALYAEDVSRFLGRGGAIAWGIVPTNAIAETETVETLVARLHQVLDLLVARGVPQDALLQAGMITPSCGLGSTTPRLAERAFELTVGVSAEMRRRYVEVGASESVTG